MEILNARVHFNGSVTTLNDTRKCVISTVNPFKFRKKLRPERRVLFEIRVLSTKTKTWTKTHASSNSKAVLNVRFYSFSYVISNDSPPRYIRNC